LTGPALPTTPAGAPTITLADSRRVPGPNLLWDRPGAMAEVSCPPGQLERFLAAWREEARRMLDRLGWTGEELAARCFSNGASLALSAPIDALFSATEVNEWAVARATERLGGPPAPGEAEAATRLRAQIAAESRPALVALHAAAGARGVTFLHDPDEVSVGGGSGSITWPIGALPAPGAVDWSRVHDVPTVLVTGSNGKTTTVRLLAAVAAAAGRVTGLSCTDSVTIAGEPMERGDWSGPAGARLVLRDRRVEFAVLETARGGILRRGLAASRAVAAIVTNIAEDHIGEWGVADRRALAETKLVVGRAVLPGGRLVLNADDDELVAAAGAVRAPILWISCDPALPRLRAHLAAGGDACWLESGTIVLTRQGTRSEVLPVADVPVTIDGAARHNVYNTLGVVALAAVAGLPLDSIRSGLRGFHGSSRENPGRLNLYRLDGVTAIVDFAHNPHGMDALVTLARALPAERRLVILGQAGDREDDAIRQLARSAWAFRPDRIILKEMAHYLRGRQPGETSDLLAQELRRLGAPPDTIQREESEFAAVRSALAWARPGDLLLLPTHAERGRVLALLERLIQSGWRPGTPLPE
jgi:UDP-N-acetylmuramyl tripeptide synthase